MNCKNRFTNIIAWVLLLVFTTGALPKIFFHDIIAHHDDVLYKDSPSGKKHLVNYTYNCGFVNDVAPIEFIPVKIEFDFKKITFPAFFQKKEEKFYYTTFYYNHFLRGPPIA
ncbi:MAG: hypothetical protein ACK5NK_02040 [Niabella sp.]